MGAMADEEQVERETTENVIRLVNSSSVFQRKYIVSSFFFVGAGAFGAVFRAVTKADGPHENPKYPQLLVASLKELAQTTKNTRRALLDPFRDDACLDVVAVKFESLADEDVSNNAIGTVNLIREYCLIRRLFQRNDARYTPVGFPLPIEFNYIGDMRLAYDYKTLIVTDAMACQTNFVDAYVNHEEFGFLPDTSTAALSSYLSMELVGPNLDDWKKYFMEYKGVNGKLCFSMQTTLKLMDQVLCRLLFMHRKDMVHLDLKPDNICMGINKMVNTVYLVDFGLSKVLTDYAPTAAVGSRRYMSVKMAEMQPSNQIMDLESWLYILIVLLTDYVPWSDEELACQLEDQNETGGARDEMLVTLVIKTKLSFWGDDGQNSRSVLNEIVKKIQDCHGSQVPDAGAIFTEIFEHVKRMRLDFFAMPHTRMTTDLRDEESDLFRRYRDLRRLLLYPYECEFAGSEYFRNDKEIVARQEERRAKHQMLTYVSNCGRDWHWDWDVWAEEMHAAAAAATTTASDESDTA